MEDTATTVVASKVWHPFHIWRCPWAGTQPTPEMHDLVQAYLDGKGVDYCVELKFFMLDIEG